MAIFSAALSSFSSISFLSPSHSQQQQQQQQPDPSSSSSSSHSFINQFTFPKSPHNKFTPWQWHHHYHRHTHKIFVSGNTHINQTPEAGLLQRPSAPDPQYDLRQARRSSGWKAAKTYIDSGLIYNGRIEGINAGGLLVRFYSIMGFLPFPHMSPVHSSKEPEKTIQEIAKGLIGSIISVKVIEADEEKRKLVLSEKEATWTKISKQVNIGDVFEGRVSSVEDYGAFVNLRFPDGLYHLTGLLHISEVSWDLVQEVRDFLTEGDQVRVKVISIDGEKSRITLSMRQLEEDPLLETLDKVIPQGGSADPDSLNGNNSSGIEPLPGLGTILEELLQEDGIYEAKISRQGFEKRVVSQDLQLWLSNAPPMDQTFTLLARAGRQVQEIHLNTSLDQEGIKKAIQRVLERVP